MTGKPEQRPPAAADEGSSDLPHSSSHTEKVSKELENQVFTSPFLRCIFFIALYSHMHPRGYMVLYLQPLIS